MSVSKLAAVTPSYTRASNRDEVGSNTDGFSSALFCVFLHYGYMKGRSIVMMLSQRSLIIYLREHHGDADIDINQD